MNNIFKAIAICGLLIAPAATASFSSRMAAAKNTMKHAATSKNFKIGTSVAALSTAAGLATYMLTKNKNYMTLTKAAPIIIVTSVFLGVLGVAIHAISAHTYKHIACLCGKRTAEQIKEQADREAIDQIVKEAMAQGAVNAAAQLLKNLENQDALEAEITILSEYFKDQAQHDDSATVQAMLVHYRELTELRNPALFALNQ